jgi:formate transporter
MKSSMSSALLCILIYQQAVSGSLKSPHGITSPQTPGNPVKSIKLFLSRLKCGGPQTRKLSPLEATDIAWYTPATATPVDSMNSVDQTWAQLEDFGELLTRYTKRSLFFRALFAGLFVGFGGILTASVGFDMGGLPWSTGSGFARLLSGAIGFPLSIILISCTGCGAWTGDMLLVSRALFSKTKRTDVKSVIRFALLTWFGCLVGTVAMAALATGAMLPACGPCIAIAQHKLEYSFLQTFLRATGGGCLICLAIFMSKLNREMMGKVIGIWFPISTYVICDFEHVLASMFFLSCAKFNGADMTYKQMFKFLIPSTLGNMFGGALLIGLGLFSIPKKMKFMADVNV